MFVHIGAPKAGTTYLQALLWSNKTTLQDHGLLLPGARKFDHNRVAQAVRSSRPGPKAQRTWRRIQHQIRDWHGDALVSNEWITMASAVQAETLVDALAPAQVHIVFTARNAVHAVPSAWQQTLKAGHGGSLDDFLAALDDDTGRWTWSNLDPARALSRWRSVPAERIHVVTVPPSGGDPNLLWKRFAATCGVAPEVCHEDASLRGNESLGAESARLLQIVGPRLRQAIDAERGRWVEPHRWIRWYLADEVLVPLGGSRITLRDADVTRLLQEAKQSARTLRNAGYDVVGDLQDLTADVRPAGAVHPDDVEDAMVVERAGVVMAELLRRTRVESRRANRQTRRARRLEARPQSEAKPSAPAGSTSQGDLRARLGRLRRRARRHPSRRAPSR